MRLATMSAGLLLATTTLWAQADATKQQADAPKQGSSSSMDARCEQMMQRQGEMSSKMKEMDERLGKLVERMRSAQGDQKLEATAAVVNELVEQRRQMHERMLTMQGMTAGHMMEHMSASGMKVECPMMKHHMKQQGSQGAAGDHKH